MALDFVKKLRGDSIDLIDQANYKKLTYLLTPDSARLVETKHLELPNMEPLQESYWINDSIMIFNTLDGDLLTYNDKNNCIIDRVKISDIVEGIPTDRAKKLGDLHLISKSRNIVLESMQC